MSIEFEVIEEKKRAWNSTWDSTMLSLDQQYLQTSGNASDASGGGSTGAFMVNETGMNITMIPAMTVATVVPP